MEAEFGDAGRVILHLDIDAFFASVEQLRDPRLRGRPVIVGNGVIASCSYEARRYGCHAGQSLSEARRVCPQVVILDGCETIYRAFAEKTFALAGEMSPAMETFLDEAFLDLTGSERLHGDLLAAAGRLQARIRREAGLPVTMGIGANRMLAKIASKSVKPNGLRWIRPEEIETVLPGLPVDRLPGVGHAIGRELTKLNVRTIGDLRAFPVEVLVRMFGAPGRALFERAWGRDTRPVEGREIPESISRETAFHQPEADPREVEGMLYYLLERGARHARGLGLAPRTVEVWVDFEESGRERRAKTLAAPTDQDAALFATARGVLRALMVTRREALRRVGMALSRFHAGTLAQGDLFEGPAFADRDRLYRGLDAVRSRYGHSAVVAGPSVRLLGRLEQDRNGFVLRTPSLTK